MNLGGYPNSPTSSCSLCHHGGVRLLWLPLSTCVKMSGLRNVTPRHSLVPLINDSARLPAPIISPYLFSQTNIETGVEKKLKKEFLSQSPIPMKELVGAFSSSSKSNYSASASLYFRIEEEIGSSQWENMEVYRRIAAVVVVLVCSEYDIMQLPSIVDSVKELFDVQYKDQVCRCIVIDPQAEINYVFSNKQFVKVQSPFNLSHVASAVLVEIGFAFVSRVNMEISRYNDPASVGDIFIRTPLDRLTSSNNLEIRRSIAQARAVKKKADLLILLGSYNAAIQALSSTCFASNADALWCASTLESIAAARLYQLIERLSSIKHLCGTIVQLQSDAVVWNASLTPLVNDIERVFVGLPDELKKLLVLYKGSCVPKSMRQRLDDILDDVMTPKVNQLKEIIKVLRMCIEAGTKELPNVSRSYFVGRDLKECVQIILQHCVVEIEVYIKECQRQCRHAINNIGGGNVATATGAASGVQNSANVAILNERYQEIHLLLLSFYAIKGNREEFLNSLSLFRNSFHIVSEDSRHELLLLYCVRLCLTCNCRRMAIAILVEIEHINRGNSTFDSAIQCLIQGCLLSGVQLQKLSLFEDLPEEVSFENVKPYQLYGNIVENIDMGIGIPESGSPKANGGNNTKDDGEEYQPDRGSCRLSEKQRLSETWPSHIPLLRELIDLIAETGCENGNRGNLALFLLFYYPHLLSKSLQEYLFFIARDVANLKEGEAPLCITLPLFSSWEALPLPPHLAPKTVSVSGPVFTFIDTSRLKLTIMSLNGRKLNSRIVWCVDDVGDVRIVMYNPFLVPLHITSMALICASYSTLNEDNSIPPDATVRRTGASAPKSYVLKDLFLDPQERRSIILQVAPQMDGYIRIEGVRLLLKDLPNKVPFTSPLAEPVGVPVLKRLPNVSCSVSISELEIFSGQNANFYVRVVNCGTIAVEHITLTAHSNACQLEDCEGCMERISSNNCTVILSKAALQAVAKTALQPGDVLTIPVTVQAPSFIEEVAADFVVFRVDCSLPHEKPTMPPDVPPAVPVFGVIPRRVTETRMRLFRSPTLSNPVVTLTRDRRFIDIRLMNLSARYSVDLYLSTLGFADLPNALLVPGAEYVVPPIEVSCVPENKYKCSVPWSVRELPYCRGELRLDLTLIENEGVCTEPLDECTVQVEAYTGESSRFSPFAEGAAQDFIQVWRSNLKYDKHGDFSATNRDSEQKNDPSDKSAQSICIAALEPVMIAVKVVSQWQRSIPLKVDLSLDEYFDIGSLTGAVSTTALVGETGTKIYHEWFELLTFKTGVHHITITLTDPQQREISYVVPINVHHESD